MNFYKILKTTKRYLTDMTSLFCHWPILMVMNIVILKTDSGVKHGLSTGVLDVWVWIQTETGATIGLVKGPLAIHVTKHITVLVPSQSRRPMPSKSSLWPEGTL